MEFLPPRKSVKRNRHCGAKNDYKFVVIGGGIAGVCCCKELLIKINEIDIENFDISHLICLISSSDIIKEYL